MELPIGYYEGMTNQLDGLLDQVNSTRCCATPGCNREPRPNKYC